MKDKSKGLQANPGAQWNDSEVIGNLDSPEAQSVLQSEITIMSALSTRTPGNEWRFEQLSVERLLEKTLGSVDVQDSHFC